MWIIFLILTYITRCFGEYTTQIPHKKETGEWFQSHSPFSYVLKQEQRNNVSPIDIYLGRKEEILKKSWKEGIDIGQKTDT